MKKLKKITCIVLYIIGIAIAIFSILSVFRNVELRYLKYPDFPRIQFFITAIIGLAILGVFIKKKKWYHYILIVGLFIVLGINGYFLINYTKLVSVEVPSVTDLKKSDIPISILLANVKMTNRNSEPLIDLIELKKPDLILAMEVDKWWDEELNILEKEYAYTQETINEVAYGMVLYSKYPLEDVEVEYLNNKNVPSFETTITLADGKHFSLHCIHPVPPTHFKNLPDNAGQQEHALKKLGKKIIDRKFPTIVAGDLNDVVWSYVDELTGTKNILFDVRVGRGFYNSYHANNFFMRWPLDHVFVTKEFRLKKLERLSKIGSDHFPIFVELVL